MLLVVPWVIKVSSKPLRMQWAAFIILFHPGLTSYSPSGISPNTTFQLFQALRVTLISQQFFMPSSFIMSSPYPASWKCSSVISLGDHLHPWRLNSNTTLSTKLVLPSWCACTLSCFSRVWLFVTLWTVAHQAPLSLQFSRQEYWSGLTCPSLGDLLNPGIKPASLESSALASRFFTTSKIWEAHIYSVGLCVLPYR